MMDLGIFGTSGHAREVGDVAHELGYRLIYIAKEPSELANWTFPGEVILEKDIDRYRGMAFAIGIGQNAARERIAHRHSDGLRFVNLVHPSATFGQNQRQAIDKSQGVLVCAGASLSNNIHVGNFTIINRNATIGHDAVVEDFAHVAPGACISGNVHLGARCWIGSGAVINQGSDQNKLHIGADTMIGSGTVVIRPCESSATYVGNPAKRIK